jgi:YHS domain-containing protein
MAIDPVCGMEVDEKTAPAKTVHNGKTYYFCAAGCKEEFEEDPEGYIEAEGESWGEESSSSCDT